MNTTPSLTLCLVAIAAAGIAGPALAQEATSDDWMILPHPQTVAQQKAAEAEADAMAIAEAKAFPDGRPGKTRAEVRAELAKARRSGEFVLVNGEAWMFDVPYPAGITRLARSDR